MTAMASHASGQQLLAHLMPKREDRFCAAQVCLHAWFRKICLPSRLRKIHAIFECFAGLGTDSGNACMSKCLRLAPASQAGSTFPTVSRFSRICPPASPPKRFQNLTKIGIRWFLVQIQAIVDFEARTGWARIELLTNSPLDRSSQQHPTKCRAIESCFSNSRGDNLVA